MYGLGLAHGCLDLHVRTHGVQLPGRRFAGPPALQAGKRPEGPKEGGHGGPRDVPPSNTTPRSRRSSGSNRPAGTGKDAKKPSTRRAFTSRRRPDVSRGRLVKATKLQSQPIILEDTGPPALTDPIKITHLDKLMTTEAAETPRFNTFCNHLSGHWLGQAAAYTPWAGQPEPVWVDQDGKYIDVVYSHAVEIPMEVDDQGRVCLVRKIARSAALEDLGTLAISTEGLGTGDDDNVDVELIDYNTNGSVIFNSGHYSCGPEYIGVEPLMEEGTSRGTGNSEGSGSGSPFMVEQCLVDWGDRSRLRLRVTMRTSRSAAGELDLDVLRILITHEHWMDAVQKQPATTGSSTTAPSTLEAPAALSNVCTQLPRPNASQIQGSWSILTFTATGVHDVDLATGKEGKIWLYSVDESRQLWDVQDGPPSGEDGGSFWLPGGLLCTFRMVNSNISSSSNISETAHSSGKAVAAKPPAAPRGLCIGMTLLQRDGTVSILEREYDSNGILREVRQSTGVKGGWSGGSM